VWYDPKNAVGDFHVLEVNNRTYFRIMGIVDPEGIKEPDEDSAMETYLFRGSSNVGADIKLKVYYPRVPPTSVVARTTRWTRRTVVCR
jgi:hypothetical protein